MQFVLIFLVRCHVLMSIFSFTTNCWFPLFCLHFSWLFTWIRKMTWLIPFSPPSRHSCTLHPIHAFMAVVLRRVISCTEQQIKCFIWITEHQVHLCTRIIEIQCKHRRWTGKFTKSAIGGRGGSGSQPSGHAPFLAGATQTHQSQATTALATEGPRYTWHSSAQAFHGLTPHPAIPKRCSFARLSAPGLVGGGADSQPLVNWFSW